MGDASAGSGTAQALCAGPTHCCWVANRAIEQSWPSSHGGVPADAVHQPLRYLRANGCVLGLDESPASDATADAIGRSDLMTRAALQKWVVKLAALCRW